MIFLAVVVQMEERKGTLKILEDTQSRKSCVFKKVGREKNKWERIGEEVETVKYLEVILRSYHSSAKFCYWAAGDYF